MGRCFKCGGKPPYGEWRICSDGPWRKVCRECDLELNKMALRWAFPRDWRALWKAYRKKALSE